MLDAMCGDISRMQSQLVGFERQKLEQMLESCRELGRQLAKRKGPICELLV